MWNYFSCFEHGVKSLAVLRGTVGTILRSKYGTSALYVPTIAGPMWALLTNDWCIMTLIRQHSVVSDLYQHCLPRSLLRNTLEHTSDFNNSNSSTLFFLLHKINKEWNYLNFLNCLAPIYLKKLTQPGSTLWLISINFQQRECEEDFWDSC